MTALACRAEGDPARPCVVLLHGFMGDKTDWAAVQAALAPSFFTLAVDLPGHGESNIDDETSFATTAAAIVEAVDDRDIATFSVVGYSMGGRLSLYFASHYSMRVDAAVVEGGSPGPRSAAERTERQAWEAAMAARLNREPTEAFLRDWYAQPLFASLHDVPGRVDALIAGRTGANSLRWAIAMERLGSGAQPDLWPELPAIHVPTLFLAGEKDAKYAALGEELAALCPNAAFASIAKAGHNTHLEQPAAFLAAVQPFLERTLL